MPKNIEIRNSTAEFLIFMLEGKEDGIQVMYKGETIWATQKAMAQLFDCSTDNIGLHLKNIGNYIPFCTKNAWAYSYLYYLLFNPFFIISSFYK